MLEFLKREGIKRDILQEIEEFRSIYPLEDITHYRVPTPTYHYYGKEIWEKAGIFLAMIGQHAFFLDF